MIRKVTLWFKGKFKVYNHLEEGHSKKGTPTSNCEYQKQAWRKGTWRKEWNYLEGYDEDIPKVAIQYRNDYE